MSRQPQKEQTSRTVKADERSAERVSRLLGPRSTVTGPFHN